MSLLPEELVQGADSIKEDVVVVDALLYGVFTGAGRFAKGVDRAERSNCGAGTGAPRRRSGW